MSHPFLELGDLFQPILADSDNRKAIRKFTDYFFMNGVYYGAGKGISYLAGEDVEDAMGMKQVRQACHIIGCVNSKSTEPYLKLLPKIAVS